MGGGEGVILTPPPTITSKQTPKKPTQIRVKPKLIKLETLEPWPKPRGSLKLKHHVSSKVFKEIIFKKQLSQGK